MASHIGDGLTADQQFVSASDQLLNALKQWEKLPPAVQASRTAQLVQLAQHRQEHMILLLQKNPQVAAARMMPKSLRDRLPPAAAAYVEQMVSVQGKVFAKVSDDFNRGLSTASFHLQTNSGASPLKLYLCDATGSERDMRKWTGKAVTMSAMRIGDHLAVLDKNQVLRADGSTTTTTTSTTSATAVTVQGDQKTLSILVNFTDAPAACTVADVATRLFGTSGATVNNNYKESSRGLVSFSGQAIGPYTIPYSSTGSCDYMGWASAANAAAKAAGIDPAQYTRVNYVTPTNSTCGWSGLAYMPGGQSWVQMCGNTGVFSHELGHNLSFDHASTPTQEYGDFSDPMGGTRLVDHNGPNRVMAGWMPAGSVLDVSAGGSYALANISLGSTTSTPQVLRFAKADTAEYYYVSVREALNLDSTLASAYVDNVSVHRAAGSLPTKTFLMQNLTTGQSFIDATNGITISNQGISNGVATVSVTMSGATCSRSAPVVAITPASQTGGAGTSLSYSISVTNQNTSVCGSSTFNLAQSLPAGFSGTLGKQSLSIAAGASSTTSWVVNSTSSLTDGTYTLTASASDTATSVSGSAHASDIVYTPTISSCVRSAPSVAVSPASQTASAGEALIYSVTVTNRDSTACATSAFTLTQALPSGFSGTFGAASVSLAPNASTTSTWSVASSSNVANGTYTFSVGAVDAATSSSGTAAATETIYTKDTTPPTLAIVSPGAGALLSGRNVSITASASDASGIQAVEFYADGTLLIRDTSAPYAATWNLRKAAAGVHALKVRAIDNAGNAAEQSISVTVQ